MDFFLKKNACFNFLVQRYDIVPQSFCVMKNIL